MSIRADFTDFDKGMRKLVAESAPDDLDKGLFRAGNALLKDAIEVMPKAPFKTGALRRAARTERPGDAPRGTGILAGFNIVYAARWHELTPEEDARISWSLPGSGRKYLETKLWMFGKQYIEIIGAFLKKRLGGK